MSKPVPPAAKAGSREPLMRLILDLLDERATPMSAYELFAALQPAVRSEGTVRKAALALAETGEVRAAKQARRYSIACGDGSTHTWTRDVLTFTTGEDY